MSNRFQPYASRALLLATLALVALWTTGLQLRPSGLAWDRVYDVVLFNAAWLTAAAAAWSAGRRAPRERLAWRAIAVALVLIASANVVRTLAVGATGSGTAPALANALAVLGYPLVWIAIVGLIRARVARFHPSMWLDGVIGALGTSALGTALLIAPYLHPAGSGARAVDLSWPIGDILLLALLVGVGAMAGVRLDRPFLTIAVALAFVAAGDVQQFVRTVDGTYTDGGPLDGAWLIGVVLAALAAHLTGSEQAAPLVDRGSRLGWRLLAVPVVSHLASVVVLVIGWNRDLPAITAVLAIGCTAAALARTAITFREVRGFNEVKAQALTDELTGLPNRRALLDAAGRQLAPAAGGAPVALLLLDLDGFKEVNDSLGHTAGDELLRLVGPRLTDGLGRGELVARLGGDEFAVLVAGAGLDRARELAEDLRQRLLRPFTVDGVRLHIGVSIGVSTAPVPATTVQELLRCADVAMYAAKTARSGVSVYVPDPNSGTGERLRTMEELRTALTEGQLVVHLQPQVDLADGRVVGSEALVRWAHPTRGLLSPAALLPAAERAGLMRQLTDTVLDLALDAASGWWSWQQVPVSVNLSAANVADLDLPGKVTQLLHRHELPAEALVLEVVEDTLMVDPERGRAVLGELRRLGVRTSIDDYGTGYSSLAYLRHLPADELKLDRSLTADVDRDPRAAAIVQHTVALAHDLGLRLVAEGVEDMDTAAVLEDLGCDVAQGFAIARPMPVADFLTWLGRDVVRAS